MDKDNKSLSEGQVSKADLDQDNQDSIAKLESKSMFNIKSANEWMDIAKNQKPMRPLFGEFWFEQELSILFADSNLGKTVLSVQIADAISKGTDILFFKSKIEPQKVIYFDFELSEKQFQLRYYDGTNNYQFHPNLHRAILDSDNYPENETDFDSKLQQDLAESIITNKVSVIIIDNLTYLKGELEKARNATPLMKALKQLKEKYKISILIIAHTPKRDTTKPIDQNSLQGSKMLINFCDSAFAIGKSHQSNDLKYIKQVKVRNAETKYGIENVIVCEMIEDGTFLKFSHIDFDDERQHLKPQSQQDKASLEASIIEIWKNNPNLSYAKIGKAADTNRKKAERTIKKYKAKNNL